MEAAEGRPLNYAAVSSVLASVVAWLGLYALYADFGTEGVDLLQRAGALDRIEGATLLAFAAVGLALTVALASGLVALAVKAVGSGVAPERGARY